MESMLNNLCSRLGVALHTDESALLYTNQIRAFARSNARRNTHMWAAGARQNEHAGGVAVYRVGGMGVAQRGQRFGFGDDSRMVQLKQIF